MVRRPGHLEGVTATCSPLARAREDLDARGPRGLRRALRAPLGVVRGAEVAHALGAAGALAAVAHVAALLHEAQRVREVELDVVRVGPALRPLAVGVRHGDELRGEARVLQGVQGLVHGPPRAAVDEAPRHVDAEYSVSGSAWSAAWMVRPHELRHIMSGTPITRDCAGGGASPAADGLAAAAKARMAT
eukprot:CAMPEP_0119274700 /NCGR_PEP_ID=MMETSP1329-20130426/12636_1 /TAXON_ID=114041 /ORGANISM="Genus nov. species nov., Strain RCC1024" /LENGTH=188 /DNA_ID=CAMNT_0007275043 /DNA_START=51 /DNA_END=615 /DNA_ORIENTATION=+